MNCQSMLALAAAYAFLSPIASAALSQDPAYVEALVVEGQRAPYTDSLGDHWTYFYTSDAYPGTDGGWVATVLLKRDASPGDTTAAIIGQLPGQLDGRVDAFVVVDPSLNHQVLLPSLVGQELTYVLRELDPATGFGVSDTVIRGNTALVRSGDPVGGSVGWTWSSFTQVNATRTGRVYVVGQALEPTTNTDKFMIAEITFGDVLANGWDFFPGVPRRISWNRFAVSPNGLHWTLTASTRVTQEFMLIRDGAIEEFAPGFMAYEGERVPSAISGNTLATWYTFENLAINDRGDLCFAGSWFTPGVTGSVRAWIRNARAIPGVAGFRVSLDERGAVIQSGDLPNGGAVEIDNKPIMSNGTLRVDTDRDGVVNPSVTVAYFLSSAALTTDGEVVVEAHFRNSSTVESFDSYIRLRDYRIDTMVCEGSPNSVGTGARIHTSGSIFPGANEARFDLLELPPQVNGYLLFSLSSGPGVIPPGAQGELCLAGSIGRLNTQVFSATDEGTARVRPNLNAIPQPNGSVRVLAGDTWYTQGWYRDASGGTPTSNFTMAVSVQFE